MRVLSPRSRVAFANGDGRREDSSRSIRGQPELLRRLLLLPEMNVVVGIGGRLRSGWWVEGEKFRSIARRGGGGVGGGAVSGARLVVSRPAKGEQGAGAEKQGVLQQGKIKNMKV